MTRYWAFQTNPADFQNVVETEAAPDIGVAMEPFGWTAPRQAVPGDLFVLYGHTPICEYAAVGRVCSRPVLSVDGNYWCHVQMACCPRSLSLAEAKSDPMIGRWPRLRMMIGSHLQIADPTVWDGFMARLVDPFPKLRSVVASWSNGAPLPRLRERIDDAVRAHPNHNRSGTSHERALQEEIRAAYIDNGWGRDLEPSDGIELDDSFYLPGTGFADIVLVDLESSKPTLLLLEIKRDSRSPEAEWDGIRQLVGYETALRRRARGWRIKKLLVALWISADVRAAARSHGIECWRYDPETEEFLEP